MLTDDNKLKLLTLAKEITLAILAREPRVITSIYANKILTDVHTTLVDLSKVNVDK